MSSAASACAPGPAAVRMNDDDDDDDLAVTPPVASLSALVGRRFALLPDDSRNVASEMNCGNYIRPYVRVHVIRLPPAVELPADGDALREANYPSVLVTRRKPEHFYSGLVAVQDFADESSGEVCFSYGTGSEPTSGCCDCPSRMLRDAAGEILGDTRHVWETEFTTCTSEILRVLCCRSVDLPERPSMLATTWPSNAKLEKPASEADRTRLTLRHAAYKGQCILCGGSPKSLYPTYSHSYDKHGRTTTGLDYSWLACIKDSALRACGCCCLCCLPADRPIDVTVPLYGPMASGSEPLGEISVRGTQTSNLLGSCSCALQSGPRAGSLAMFVDLRKPLNDTDTMLAIQLTLEHTQLHLFGPQTIGIFALEPRAGGTAAAAKRSQRTAMVQPLLNEEQGANDRSG